MRTLPLLLATALLPLAPLASHATPVLYTLTFTAPVVSISPAPFVFTYYNNQTVTIEGYGDTNAIYTSSPFPGISQLTNPLSAVTLQVGSLPLLYAANSEQAFITSFNGLPPYELYFGVQIGSPPANYALADYPSTPVSFLALGLQYPLTDGSTFATVCEHFTPTGSGHATCADVIHGTFSATTAATSPVPEPSSILLLGTGLLAFNQALRRRRV